MTPALTRGWAWYSPNGRATQGPVSGVTLGQAGEIGSRSPVRTHGSAPTSQESTAAAAIVSAVRRPTRL